MATARKTAAKKSVKVTTKKIARKTAAKTGAMHTAAGAVPHKSSPAVQAVLQRIVRNDSVSTCQR